MSAAAARLSDEAIAAATSRVDANTSSVMLRLDGLHCGACVGRLEKSLDRTADASVDIPSGTCELRWNPSRTNLPALLERVRAARLEPSLLAPDTRYEEAQGQQRTSLIRIGIAALFGMQIMMLASSEYFSTVDSEFLPLVRYAQWLLATPVLLYSGWPLLSGGLGALRQRALVMDTPVAIALIGAYTLSGYHTLALTGEVYFDSVGMFVFLLLLARHCQARGQVLAADRLRRLVAGQPLTALRIADDEMEEVPVAQLQAGDRISVAPGTAVPADGVLETTAELDESLLSGESAPQGRQVGEKALAGSVNLSQRSIGLRVEVAGNATVLSQIARLVQQAHLERAAVRSLADRVARWLVPFVLIMATAAVFYWWPDSEKAAQAALAVLVITCPCALSLAVPTSLAAAVTRLGRRGVLLVHPESLQTMEHISDVVFDKTGTLTTRAMHIGTVRALTDRDETEIRRVAGVLEAGLAHPIARAFQESPKTLPPEDREVRPGVGVFGGVDGVLWSLESRPADTSHDAGQRWFVLRREGVDQAEFGLQENLRPNVHAVLAGLKASGIQLHVLSGDREEATHSLAEQVGITSIHSAQHPDDKLAYVRQLQASGSKVLVVGDGMNDGPVLAGADVSVSLGSGAALAQAQGDAILMTDDMAGLNALRDTATQARRVIRQNVTWALAYNLTLIPVAFLGYIVPWIAAIGMGASSLFVTLNALRLLREKPVPEPPP